MPLSIVAVGVGDGEGFDQLRAFDDRLPAAMGGRADTWDNFQFVPFNVSLAAGRRFGGGPGGGDSSRTDAAFALQALMEVPQQYREIGRRGLLDRARTGHARLTAVPLLGPPEAAAAPASQRAFAVPWPAAAGAPPPAPASLPAAAGGRRCPHCTFENDATPKPLATDACAVCGLQLGGPAEQQPQPGSARATAPPPYAPTPPPPRAAAAPAPPPAVAAASAASGEAARLAAELAAVQEGRACPVCLDAPKDTAFGCGHQACGGCAALLRACPVCRAPVTARIRLYG